MTSDDNIIQSDMALDLVNQPDDGNGTSMCVVEREEWVQGGHGHPVGQPYNWRNWFSSPSSDPFPAETFGLDISASMREMLGITDGDLQGQLILGPTQHAGPGNQWFPESPSAFTFPPMFQSGSHNDGVMRIKYLRAHGRTAYIPGEFPID
jgi:hypothetical protein